MKISAPASQTHALGHVSHGWMNEDFIIVVLIATLAFLTGFYCAVQLTTFAT